MSRAQSVALQETFAAFQPVLREEPLGDFSRLDVRGGVRCEVAPRNTEDVCALVRTARERGVPLRLRAQGHSLNGATLPAPGELLVSTRRLRGVRFEAPGSVTAGAGAVLWLLQDLLRRSGHALPVVNDGYPGPSVGGYLAAGGFGPGSAEHGGFWDNVLEVALVDGNGVLHRLGPGDARFAWLFGAMGQLGIVAEARLALRALDGGRAYPAGARLRVPQLAGPIVPRDLGNTADDPLFWFTLFVPEAQLDLALQGLDALERRHAGALHYAERYRYPVRYRGRVAPLVYPYERDFIATGAWGWLTAGAAGGARGLHALDADFMALALSMPDWRRYIQSEVARGPEAYARHFSAEALSHLHALKREMDPAGLFNRGSVFAGPG